MAAVKCDCPYCGKEIYIAYLSGAIRSAEMKGTGKNNKEGKVFVEHTCDVADVLKNLEE